MTLEVVSFLLGGLLLIIALVGGGFELREVKFPPVGMATRGVCLLIGAFFLLLGIGGSEMMRVAQENSAPVRTLQPAAPSSPVDPAPRPEPSPVRAADLRDAPAPPPVQATPPDFTGITGRAQLDWMANGVPHRAFVELHGRRGGAQVMYGDEVVGIGTVYQDLELRQDGRLLYYMGSNPRDPADGTPASTYSPDGFRLVEVQSGVWSITEVCDLQGVCAPVVTTALN